MNKWIKADTDKPIINKIWIEHIEDSNPDLSYLESKIVDGKVESVAYSQKEYDEDPKQVEKYIAEDTARLQSYGDSWYTFGIRAAAEVGYKSANYTRLEKFSSGGLWGIESDSESSFIKDAEKDQLSDLKSHLERFGIDVSDFDKKVSGEIKEV